MNATVKTTPATKAKQIRLSKASATYWRVTFDYPPLNLMGPEFLLEFDEIITAIESDEQRRVVVFDSAVDGFFPSLLELRHIANHPTMNRRARHGNAALGHHRHEIPIAQSVRDVPAYAQLDDLGIEPPPSVTGISNNWLGIWRLVNAGILRYRALVIWRPRHPRLHDIVR